MCVKRTVNIKEKLCSFGTTVRVIHSTVVFEEATGVGAFPLPLEPREGGYCCLCPFPKASNLPGVLV